MESTSLKQGEAHTWLVRPNILSAGEAIPAHFACSAGVYNASLQSVVDAFEVTDKRIYEGSEYFVVTLSRATTKELLPGFYLEVIDVRSDAVSPPYSQESHIHLKIEAQAIAIP